MILLVEGRLGPLSHSVDIHLCTTQFIRHINLVCILYIIPHKQIFRCLCLGKGFGLVTGFIGLLQILSTNSYAAVSNSHSPHFTKERTKSSHSSVTSAVHSW
jgi:hypothetical protein